MQRVAVILGSGQMGLEGGSSLGCLPKSDRAAIGLAVRRLGGTVAAYCLHNDEAALRYALAAGVATATRVDDITGLDFDIALVGSGGAEPWGELLPARLAEQKQCAMVLEVLDITPSPGGLTVPRDLGRGRKEVLRLRAPAVLGIAEEAVQLLYVSHYRQQAVPPGLLATATGPTGRPPVAEDSPWEPLRPRVRTSSLAAQAGSSASGRLQALLDVAVNTSRDGERAHVIVADAATCAQHLLRFLRHHGMLPPSTLSPLPPAPVDNTVVQDKPGAPAAVWAPHRRGPRPLQGEWRGLERQPRPLPPHGEVLPPSPRAAHTRGPRPVGQAASQPRRGPRPVDAGFGA